MVNFIIFLVILLFLAHAGFGFFHVCACMYVCVCVRVLIWMTRSFYHFFIFKKFKPQKKIFFKEHLYQRQIAVFQSTATCLFSFCPLRKDTPAWLRERNRWDGWHRSWELEISPRPEETCLLKGRGMWLLSASLRPPPLEYMKLQALLCFKRQLRLRFF